MGIKVEVKLIKAVIKLRLRLRSRLVSRLWSKLIFKLRKCNLNYLFKYWKSVAESSQIIIMVPT